MTYRQEEAIERLAEESARVRLSDEVGKADVERALRLVRKSLKQVRIDPETGEYDADIIETGQSKSQRDRRKQVLAIIDDQDGTDVAEIADILDCEEDQINHDVEHLKKRGDVYNRGDDLRAT